VSARDRRQRIEDICDAALDRDGVERAAFLNAECGGDETLRREVGALLAHAQAASGFLATPVEALAAAVMPTESGPSLIGRQVGAYRILSQLGAGGMGEVYRARDTQLGRDVAIKVLPPAFVADRDRLARFEQEARVLASMNHPHIGAIYGFERVDPSIGAGYAAVPALVLELVEGETLADRIARGPLPVAEALQTARQIADALEAAHEHGIIHRDLKPANIKVRADGTVKVLDFGLAKALTRTDGSSADAMNSPTFAPHATESGIILGTAAYMSPEQAAGRAVDKRSDLWAFGVVLLEMLTGRHAFAGDTVSHVLAAVLKDEPDGTTLPENTPAPIRRLLRRCLDKDRKRRLDSAAAARLEIDDVLTAEPAPVERSTRRVRLLVGVAAALVVAVVVIAIVGSRRSPVNAPMRVTVDLGGSASMPMEVGPNVSLSPDGSTLAFVALKPGSTISQLYLRRLDQLSAVPLSGTDDARQPFFSPDGHTIAFFDATKRKLKKVSTAGGTPVTLADAEDPRGGAWIDDGAIVFQPSPGYHGLMRVSEVGGVAESFVVAPEIKESIRWPQMLPGGKAVLYTAGVAARFENGIVAVQRLPAGKADIILRNAYYGRYVSTGHILYLHEETLFAVPFDVNRLVVTGPAVQVIEHVAGSAGTGGAEFEVSRGGTLMYVPREAAPDVISWMDRSGQSTVLRAAPGIWTEPSFSPEGDRLAMEISEGGQFNVWLYDWRRATATKLTFDRTGARRPRWTPDGRRIAFGAAGQGPANLFWIRADGTGEAQRLTESTNRQLPESWHPSGRFLAYTEYRADTQADLMVLPMSGDEASGWKPGTPAVFLRTPFYESNPVFSPDGRWIAYESDETGNTEVFVRPFPGPGAKVPISIGGGNTPRWSPAKPELLYRGADSRIMAASYVEAGDSFRAEKPRLWSPRLLPASITRPMQRGLFTVHPDGERVALYVPPDAALGTRDKVVLVLNFFDELRRLSRPAR
jgi:serine/threonine protein kinase/Tol biopolymer transport system component